MRIFGIDPGTDRTGYGCLESDGSRHHLVLCGSLNSPLHATFPEKLRFIHDGLAQALAGSQPECVAIESLFYARNARSALKLGHARGVAVLAAVEADLPVVEYTPAEIKRAVVGYGRAEKRQMQLMMKLLLGLATVPSPHDVADALAVALCHAHANGLAARLGPDAEPGPGPRSWRQYRPRTPSQG